MDIVMLAAGTSSRMGRTNKMLLTYNGMPMVTHCCMQALTFLEDHSLKTDESCTLVVVTGYRRPSVEKALLDCKLFIQRTRARLEMLVVNNPDYRKGQFSSTKVGVAQVKDQSPFFISLADMPLVMAENYDRIAPLLGDHDAVRPFCIMGEDRVPGHPVLHAPRLKEMIIKCPDDYTVSRILKSCDVHEPLFEDSSWALDIDNLQDYDLISSPTIAF